MAYKIMLDAGHGGSILRKKGIVDRQLSYSVERVKTESIEFEKKRRRLLADKKNFSGQDFHRGAYGSYY